MNKEQQLFVQEFIDAFIEIHGFHPELNIQISIKKSNNKYVLSFISKFRKDNEIFEVFETQILLKPLYEKYKKGTVSIMEFTDEFYFQYLLHLYLIP